MRARISLLSIVLLSLFAFSATAQELSRVARPDNAPLTVGEFMQRIVASGAKRRPKIAPRVIGVETADVAFIIPAAGSVQGANGTFFKSDLSIGNFNSNDQVVGIGWLAAGQNNTNELLTYFTIPANSVVSYADFVGSQLKRSGLGALFVGAYTSSTATALDGNALIDGFSRIWTPQPGVASGTVSQSFPAISVLDSEGQFTAFAMGLRQDANFRTNVGIVNLDSAAHTFTVQSATGVQSTMTVQPFSLSQGGIAAGSASQSGFVTLLITPNDSADFFWSAYASSTDNATGDGWVSRATQ